MSQMAAEKALDPKLVIDLLRQRRGDFPFSELVQALQEQGFDESGSRELIWRTLALGFIEFTNDRSALRILPDDEGRVA